MSDKEITSQEQLVTTAKRLERLLGGNNKNGATNKSSSSSSSSNGTLEKKTVVEAATTMIHSNPSKIVKRWLGTSSGISSKITLADVSLTAQTLLDPTGSCATGRDILVQLSPPVEKMQTEGEDEDKEEEKFLVASAREMEAYLFTLAIRILWSEEKKEEAMDLSIKAIQIAKTHIEEAEARPHTVTGISAGSANGLFPLLARLYRYQGLVSEGLVNRREELVHAHRMAVMRRDVDTQATLLNLMLRELLNADQVEQAQKLLANSTFPESASNNQLCRYLYYSGRIQALRLEYTSSFSNLSQCLRKAPTNTGLGFRIAVQRLLIAVQLLMGEIPERNVFFTKDMVVELNPYLKITQAVRRGDLAVFKETVSQFTDRLKCDGTYTLISRLAHSVVKAGLRRLNTSYSRISLDDIAHRLGLANATSAEFVVSKAVRDGVIDATIFHEEGYMQCHELVDVYATVEPMEAFHRRIAYCLTTHNDAVRGMRYPPDEYKKQLEASRGLRGKKDEDKTDEEKAQELEDEMDGDY